MVARAPSAKVAKDRALAKLTLKKKKEAAMKAEEKLRKDGGYGRGMVSIHDIPPGGIEKSPAYRKVLSRCGGTKMPPSHERAGAPVKGGFPLNKYPPNVLVDGQRAYWLPDDWAQVIKNTGPGGTYLGWMSPEGKFFYHRQFFPTSIEETLGRRLSALDGFNGIMRNIRNVVKPNADKEFLQQCLTPAERKHVLPADKFHFGVVSARRATDDQGILNIMVVEGHFRNAGVKPTWYVDADSLDAYKKLGLIAKVGGKLTPARNMVLDDAKKAGKRCVQVSDDISKWEYLNVEKQNLRGEKTFHKANAALAGTKPHIISPVASAQFILAKMRSSPAKPQLGGVFPTANAALTMGIDEYSTEHFMLGDFFVVDSSPCRFDTDMTLKEDYDFTCSHIDKHGSVLRCNRMFVHAKHSTNAGGAVATRDESGSKERYNIAILQRKWPGVFKLNVKRKDEVLMNWSNRGCENSTKDEKATKKNIQVGGCTRGIAKSSKGQKSSTVAVKKTSLKLKLDKCALAFPPSAKVCFTGQGEGASYMVKRCKKQHGRTVQQCLGMKYADASGTERSYGIADLRYDIKGGRLKIGK